MLSYYHKTVHQQWRLANSTKRWLRITAAIESQLESNFDFTAGCSEWRPLCAVEPATQIVTFSLHLCGPSHHTLVPGPFRRVLFIKLCVRADPTFVRGASSFRHSVHFASISCTIRNARFSSVSPGSRRAYHSIHTWALVNVISSPLSSCSRSEE